MMENYIAVICSKKKKSNSKDSGQQIPGGGYGGGSVLNCKLQIVEFSGLDTFSSHFI